MTDGVGDTLPAGHLDHWQHAATAVYQRDHGSETAWRTGLERLDVRVQFIGSHASEVHEFMRLFQAGQFGFKSSHICLQRQADCPGRLGGTASTGHDEAPSEFASVPSPP